MLKNNIKVQMKCFFGVIVSDMESYVILIVCIDLSEIILYVGMNDFCDRFFWEVVEDIINLCEDILQNIIVSVIILGFIYRIDELSMGDKVIERNRIIKLFVSGCDLSFIDNSKIGSSMLNSSGLYLSQKGGVVFVKNILNYISNCY